MSTVALAEDDIRNRMKLADVRLTLHANKKAQVSDLSREINELHEQIKRDCLALHAAMKNADVKAIVVGDLMAECGSTNPEYFFKRVRVIPYDAPDVPDYKVANPLTTHTFAEAARFCAVCKKTEIEVVCTEVPCLGYCLQCNHKVNEAGFLGTICDNCGMSEIGAI